MTLLSRLRACVPDEQEIAQLLHFAAAGGTRITKSGAVEYLSGESGKAVMATLHFKSNRITQLSPGPALRSKMRQDQLVEQFRTEAAQTHGLLISSRVVFSELPLRGGYRWTDRLRISPCPRTARIRKGLDWSAHVGLPGYAEQHLGPPYPFVLEVSSFRSQNPFLQTNRALRALDTYQALLTLLLHGRIRYAYNPSGRHWVGVKRSGKVEYHLLHLGFDAGLSGRADAFAPRRMKSAPIHPGKDYYNHLWGADRELHIPVSLTADLAIYHALSPEATRQFNRACYWHSLGVQMASEPAISAVAFATAVECLLPRPSAVLCPVCGKPCGSGPTKLFKDHVKRYSAVPTELKSRRDKIYAARSALVHGSHAQRTDEYFFTHSMPFLDGLFTEIVAQRSLIGWLRDPCRTH